MPNVGKHLLFSFLTTEPNGVVEPIHEKDAGADPDEG
jgi:putative SOS response-associated peptidase YedK